MKYELISISPNIPLGELVAKSSTAKGFTKKVQSYLRKSKLLEQPLDLRMTISRDQAEFDRNLMSNYIATVNRDLFLGLEAGIVLFGGFEADKIGTHDRFFWRCVYEFRIKSHNRHWTIAANLVKLYESLPFADLGLL
jgi:hypothetical protein